MNVFPRARVLLGAKPPPLENGDRLSREEFERRYEAMPEVKKAELLEGVVYMASPARHTLHGRPHIVLNGWLFQYLAATPGVDGGDNSTVRLDPDNEVQPDCFLRLEPTHGGGSHIDEDGYISGPMELAAEVASSSVSYDLGPKLEVYRRCGVREYVVWRVLDEALDWFILRGDRYEPLTADENGVLKSETFPGLWLNRPALLRGDLTQLLATLQQGVSTEEHQAFLTRLRQA